MKKTILLSFGLFLGVNAFLIAQDKPKEDATKKVTTEVKKVATDAGKVTSTEAKKVGADANKAASTEVKKVEAEVNKVTTTTKTDAKVALPDSVSKEIKSTTPTPDTKTVKPVEEKKPAGKVAPGLEKKVLNKKL